MSDSQAAQLSKSREEFQATMNKLSCPVLSKICLPIHLTGDILCDAKSVSQSEGSGTKKRSLDGWR